AAFGASVVVTGRKQEALEAVAQEIRTAAYEATAVAAQVGDRAALEQLVDQAVKTYGGVYILVNNAATSAVAGPLLDTDTAVFDRIMAVNVKGPLELAKLVQPLMAARGGGSIMNVSSISGLRPSAGLGYYGVSKAA